MSSKIRYRIPKLGLNVTNKSIRATASNAKSYAKNSIIRSPATGNKWPQFSSRSSEEGNPPVNQSGKLFNSIKFRTSLNSGNIKSFDLYSDLEYAAALEFGKSGDDGGVGGPIAPRPFLRPAMEKATRYYINNEFEKIQIYKDRTGKWITARG